MHRAASTRRAAKGWPKGRPFCVQDESGRLYDMPWGKNLKAVIDVIHLVDPDIVGLREVAGAGQASKLGKALNMNAAYVGRETARSGSSWWGVD